MSIYKYSHAKKILRNSLSDAASKQLSILLNCQYYTLWDGLSSLNAVLKRFFCFNSMSSYGFAPRGGYGGYSGYGGFRGMRGAYRGRGAMPLQEFRPVIHYRDLDAPREPDEFI